MSGITEILAALSNWAAAPEPLIGVPETQRIEFKERAYRLESELQKLEFAKDISAMANAGGGLIVLGIRTQRDEAIGRDVSEEITPLQHGTVNFEQMHSVARDWIYPPQRDLEIREWRGDADEMLVTILVPPFSELGGLSLVRASEADGRADRRTFGVTIRTDAKVDFFTHAEVYEWIRRGRLAGVAGTHEAPARLDQDLVDGELERAREIDQEWPVLVLQAWPAQVTRLERIHDREGVRGLFLDPPTLRPHGGFNLSWLARVEQEPDRDGGIRASAGRRESLWILPQGVATFAGTGGPDLLCWGMEQFSRALVVNPTALAELIFEFGRLYLAVAHQLEPAVDGLLFRVGLLECHRQTHLKLGEGVPRRGGFGLGRVTEAPTNDVIEDVGPVSPSTSPERIAGALLRRLYGRFGHGSETIPYLDEEAQQFDTEKFLQLSSR